MNPSITFLAGASRFGGASPDLPFHVNFFLFFIISTPGKLNASVYHVNTQEGSPSHFSNKSYTLIIFFADNQFVHVIIK